MSRSVSQKDMGWAAVTGALVCLGGAIGYALGRRQQTPYCASEKRSANSIAANLTKNTIWNQFKEMNRANWNDRVPIHTQPGAWFYGDAYAKLQRGESCLPMVDQKVLQSCVKGAKVLHLQCHFGLDSLSMLVHGASSVTGVDFSEPAIAAAHQRRDALGYTNAQARFVCSDVYEAVEALNGEQYDVVFTSIGALCWLPDINAWAEVVAQCLKPGGIFYIRDGHPLLNSLATSDFNDPVVQVLGSDAQRWKDSKGCRPLTLVYPYWQRPLQAPMCFHGEYTYSSIDEEAAARQKPEEQEVKISQKLNNTATVEWNHALSETINALISAGMRIEWVREHKELEWRHLDDMVQGSDGLYRLPAHQQELCPLAFSLRAVKM